MPKPDEFVIPDIWKKNYLVVIKFGRCDTGYIFFGFTKQDIAKYFASHPFGEAAKSIEFTELTLADEKVKNVYSFPIWREAQTEEDGGLLDGDTPNWFKYTE